MPDARSTILVAVGGAAGATARWSVVATTAGAGPFPWWTLLVNLVGSFLLGMLIDAPRRGRLLLGAGFCGGLTTFSTFAVELADLLDSGDAGIAAAYLAASAVLGLGAAISGRRLAPAW